MRERRWWYEKEFYLMEIYAHDLSVTPDEDEPEILCISGKDWENQPFKLFLRPEDVQLVLLQLGFYVS